MAQDLVNELTTLTVMEPRQLVVGSGTQSYAGVDIRGYVGKIKLMVSHHSDHNLGTNSIIYTINDSADNSTFAINTNATAITSTASTYTGSITVDTRLFKRYIQASVAVSGTTQTAQIAILGVAKAAVT